MGISIKTKIMLFSSMLLLAVLLCQIIFSVFLSKNYYTNLKKNEVETLFYNLKNSYSDDLNSIRDIIHKAEDAQNISIRIFSNNRVIYENRGLGILPPELNFFNRDTHYSLKPKATVSNSSEQSQMLQIAPPEFETHNIELTGRFEYGQEFRYVRITTSMEAIDTSVAALTRVNAVIAVFVLIVGIFSSFVFAKRFSKPIQNIQKVAQNVALLNFDVRADENLSTMELRGLSGNINSMADKLQSLIANLQDSNEKLQADVDYQKRIEKMRREFVANVSHELKTPLHLLLMYSENLKNNIDNIDKDYYCNTIIEETNRLNDLVKSLLDLSAIENGLTKMNMKRMDFSDFCGYISSKMSVLFDKAFANFIIEKEICVEGDEKYLEQAIKNYLINAVSHTHDKGEISIRLNRQCNRAIFSVFNEGSHIKEENLAHIWESFYKTDKARKRTEENHSGLGLYIVKTIIEAHSGEYGVRNVENGVEFWFSLPMINENFDL